MSTLVAYSSKRGFTKNCVEILAKKLDGSVDIYDLESNKPDLTQYGKVIIGGSVYAGKIRKQVARFCTDNLDVLKDKKLGLFICGMAEGDDAQKELEASFPQELISAALAKESFGGEFDFGKMNFIERQIIKKISGSGENQTRFSEDSITRFAEIINNA